MKHLLTAHRLGLRVQSKQTIFRFLAVGSAAAAGYVVICAVLTHLMPEFAVAISIATHVTLVPVAFMGQRHITFRSEGQWSRELPRYALLQAISITLSTSALIKFVTGNPWTDIPAFLAIAGLAALISYIICRFAIFASPSRLDR